METGVDGMAVVSAIIDQMDIREAAWQLLSLVKGAKA